MSKAVAYLPLAISPLLWGVINAFWGTPIAWVAFGYSILFALMGLHRWVQQVLEVDDE